MIQSPDSIQTAQSPNIEAAEQLNIEFWNSISPLIDLNPEGAPELTRLVVMLRPSQSGFDTELRPTYLIFRLRIDDFNCEARNCEARWRAVMARLPLPENHASDEWDPVHNARGENFASLLTRLASTDLTESVTEIVDEIPVQLLETSSSECPSGQTSLAEITSSNWMTPYQSTYLSGELPDNYVPDSGGIFYNFRMDDEISTNREEPIASASESLWTQQHLGQRAVQIYVGVEHGGTSLVYQGPITINHISLQATNMIAAFEPCWQPLESSRPQQRPDIDAGDQEEGE